MVREGFNTDLRCQREWGWLLAIWLFLSGTASALFLYFRIFSLPPFIAQLSLGLLLLGGLVLLLEQGNPARAWRAPLRVRTSWLSRGVLFVSAFVVSCFFYLAPEFLSWLPWDANSVSGQALAWIATLCALMIILYPGFFLAKNRSIPFWNTLLLPAIFVTYAALGGAATLLIGGAFLGEGLRQFGSLAAALLVLNFVVFAVYLLVMHRAGGPARESVRLLNRAPLSWSLRIGVVGVGMVLPLAMLLGPSSLEAPAGACILVGSLLLRYCLLKVGVYIPTALVEGVDFSRLNRSGDDLEREYRSVAGRYANG